MLPCPHTRDLCVSPNLYPDATGREDLDHKKVIFQAHHKPFGPGEVGSINGSVFHRVHIFMAKW